MRYVCINSRLQMIPQSPLKILRAPLIPWRDKFRVLGDLFTPPLDGEPTVAKWAAHRFGRALLPYVDAVFTGTYAGDYNELKIDAVMPGVRELEHTHGSVIRGAIAKARAARKKKGGERLEMPSMTSFPEGMERLPQRLTEILQEKGILIGGSEAARLERTVDGWDVHTADSIYRAQNLILALPVNQGLRLLDHVGFKPPVGAIPEAWINTVVLGFDHAQVGGFLLDAWNLPGCFRLSNIP